MTQPTSIAIDRSLGSIVGLAIGDALGTSLEGADRSVPGVIREMVGGEPHHLDPGQWTDDTAMTLCLMDSLEKTGGRVLPRDLMARFSEWMDQGSNSCTGTAFDIGWTTRGSISEFKSTGNPITGPRGRDSAGNGNIMRLAPAVVANLTSEDRAVAAAIAQSSTTHAAPQCLEAADMLARILHRLIHSAPGREQSARRIDHRYTESEMADIARCDYETKDRGEIKSTGYVTHTLEAALWSFSRHGDFETTVAEAINLGGDADTVGAVAGQIAGAAYGFSSIPARWLDKLAWHDDIEARARRLIEVGASPEESILIRFRKAVLGR